MFAVGDRVKIINHSTKEYIGKEGRVIYVGSIPKGATQPVNVELPKWGKEPYYGMVLDDGREVHNLKENQLEKLG